MAAPPISIRLLSVPIVEPVSSRTLPSVTISFVVPLAESVLRVVPATIWIVPVLLLIVAPLLIATSPPLPALAVRKST